MQLYSNILTEISNSSNMRVMKSLIRTDKPPQEDPPQFSPSSSNVRVMTSLIRTDKPPKEVPP